MRVGSQSFGSQSFFLTREDTKSGSSTNQNPALLGWALTALGQERTRSSSLDQLEQAGRQKRPSGADFEGNTASMMTALEIVEGCA